MTSVSVTHVSLSSHLARQVRAYGLTAFGLGQCGLLYLLGSGTGKQSYVLAAMGFLAVIMCQTVCYRAVNVTHVLVNSHYDMALARITEMRLVLERAGLPLPQGEHDAQEATDDRPDRFATPREESAT